ncbi:MAG TPA: ribose 5-phosphate isomerase A, partial [Thermoplasmata archaeon]|nr:ribose 5-phosphate isomerase A [Thermoplasmata archaeon]
MTSDLDRAKEAAARAAVEEIRPGEHLALGTGTTAAYAVREIARRFPDRSSFDCVASSVATEALARELGLPIRDLGPGDRFDRMIDGADEVSDHLDLTKGRGGALFREKLLARLSRRLVVIVDPTKLVARLGMRAPIPIEVVPFARPFVLEELSRRGFGAALRTAAGSSAPFRTDNGLELIDVRPPHPIEGPESLDAELHGIP